MVKYFLPISLAHLSIAALDLSITLILNRNDVPITGCNSNSEDPNLDDPNLAFSLSQQRIIYNNKCSNKNKLQCEEGGSS